MKKVCFCLIIVLVFIMYTGAEVNATADITFENPPLQTHECEGTHRDLKVTEPITYGYDVEELQMLLTEAGYALGAIDGYYGKKTEEAVRQFQKDNSLEATGIATWDIWLHLAQGLEDVATKEKLEKPEGNVSIVIDSAKKTLTVYDDDKVHVVLPVAVGKHKTPTPVGEWRIVSKGAWGGGFGTRWMGLNVPWGIYGIHGTNKPHSIGNNASAGCIRMFNRDVEKLFEIIPVGTPVKIQGEPKYPPGFKNRNLKKGMSGPDVVQVQSKLKQAGLFIGRADGRYGASTEVFVKRFQALTGLEITGEFKKDDYEHLDHLIEVLHSEQAERSDT